MNYCGLFFARAWITRPREVSERLMNLCSSICCSFNQSSVSSFSEPARSQRLSLDHHIVDPLKQLVSSMTWNTVWDLDEWMLNFVSHVTQFDSPLLKSTKQSSTDHDSYSVSPSTNTPSFASSQICKGLKSLSWKRS